MNDLNNGKKYLLKIKRRKSNQKKRKREKTEKRLEDPD